MTELSKIPYYYIRPLVCKLMRLNDLLEEATGYGGPEEQQFEEIKDVMLAMEVDLEIRKGVMPKRG